MTCPRLSASVLTALSKVSLLAPVSLLALSSLAHHQVRVDLVPVVLHQV